MQQEVFFDFADSNHSVNCTTPVTGATIHRVFGTDQLLLACFLPGENGESKCFRLVSKGDLVHLDDWDQVVTTYHELLAHIN